MSQEELRLVHKFAGGVSATLKSFCQPVFAVGAALFAGSKGRRVSDSADFYPCEYERLTAFHKSCKLPLGRCRCTRSASVNIKLQQKEEYCVLLSLCSAPISTSLQTSESKPKQICSWVCAVPPAGVIPEGREGEALRPCIFDKKGQMLPPGIPGQLVLLPFDVAAHEAEYGA